MENDGVAHFPPGSPAPTTADRFAKLRDPDHLSKLNAARAEWLAKPKEERSAIIKQRREEKLRKAAEREARRAAKRGRGRAAEPSPPSDAAPESGPPTQRSSRPSMMLPPSDRVSEQAEATAEDLRPMVGPVRGLMDLCASMPTLGDGACFIQVVRLKPTMVYNVPCAGPQKNLWDAIDDAEFAMIYGGGEYSLRGYVTRDDGRSPKPITEPVPYKAAGVPNPESMLTEEDTIMQRPMRQNGVGQGHQPGLPLRRTAPVAPQAAAAEAEMYSRGLQHQETMDEREERRAERRRQAQEEQARRQQDSQLEAVRVLAESKDKEAERLREVYESRGNGSSVAELAQLLQAMGPRDEGSRELVRQHAQEIKQLSESHKEELVRINDQHGAEVRRLMEQNQQALQRLEDQARADRERADSLVREAERRAGESVREVERRADARVQDVQNSARSQYDDLKTRSEERLSDLNRSWEARFNDARESHGRELKRKDDEILIMRSNMEGNQQILLSQKDSEIKRLQSDLREARELAERNKDWVGKIKEFGEQAEVLGYSKGSDGEGAPEEDTKTLLIKGGMQALQRLPEMIQSGANALAAMRNPAGVPSEAARTQARSGMVRSSMRTVPRTHMAPQLQSLPFATEDSDFAAAPPAPPMRARSMPPTTPDPVFPLEQSPVAPYMAPPQPHEPPMASQPPMAAYTTNPEQPRELMPPPPPSVEAPHVAMPPQPPPPVSLQPTTPPPAGGMAPAPVSGAIPSALEPHAVALLEQILPEMMNAFEVKQSPIEVAQIFVQQTSVEMVRTALEMVTIEQILSHINQNAGAYGNLATRNGHKFLRDVWKSAETVTASGAQ